MPAQDVACVEIHQHKQVGEAADLQFQVSNITDPDLVGVGDGQAGQPVRSSPQARNGRPPVGFAPFNQQIFVYAAAQTSDLARSAASQLPEAAGF